MLPFAGYNMPILYEGVNAEHETVRNAVERRVMQDKRLMMLNIDRGQSAIFLFTK
jgi:glycine cleavage system aminomethyltransferase T